MIADFHIHSKFSDDSQAELTDIVHYAISKGIKEICITDHIEYKNGHPTRPSQVLDLVHYRHTLENLQQQFQEQITVRIGAEFGLQKHTIENYLEDFKRCDFDFIILSSHQISNQGFWIQEYQESRSQHDYNVGYYENLLALIETFDDFSVVGHLDLIRRYDQLGWYQSQETDMLVDRILKLIISKNKGIEVNTSSLRSGKPDPLPAYEIISRYYELGGRILTIGSDAHKAQDVGSDFESVITVLKAIGFKQLCTFVKMQPVYYDI